ncbi:hypothetical protein AB4342_19820, partial [Vibrio breoganii]
AYNPADKFEVPATPSCPAGYTFDGGSSMCIADSLPPFDSCGSNANLVNGVCRGPNETICKNDSTSLSLVRTTSGTGCGFAPSGAFYWEGVYILSSGFSSGSLGKTVNPTTHNGATYTQSGTAQYVG